jgi:hypothetical protein
MKLDHSSFGWPAAKRASRWGRTGFDVISHDTRRRLVGDYQAAAARVASRSKQRKTKDAKSNLVVMPSRAQGHSLAMAA